MKKYVSREGLAPRAISDLTCLCSPPPWPTVPRRQSTCSTSTVLATPWPAPWRQSMGSSGRAEPGQRSWTLRGAQCFRGIPELSGQSWEQKAGVGSPTRCEELQDQVLVTWPGETSRDTGTSSMGPSPEHQHCSLFELQSSMDPRLEGRQNQHQSSGGSCVPHKKGLGHCIFDCGRRPAKISLLPQASTVMPP